MWQNVTKLFGGGSKRDSARAPVSLHATMQALNESAAEAPSPTLVCRQCGLKYDNTGTFLQGSRCPACYPNG